MFIPEETIVPQIAHQLCSLFQARIVCDPHFTLLKRFTCKLINQRACEAFIGRLTSPNIWLE